jgi:hypothetical protein
MLISSQQTLFILIPQQGVLSIGVHCYPGMITYGRRNVFSDKTFLS